MGYEYTPRKDRSGPWLRRRIRQCSFVYFYYMDREFGLMYVRLQTWLPMDIQIGVNGREYLARRMDRAGMEMYDKQGSVLRIETTIVNPKRFRVYREVTRLLSLLRSHKLIKKVPHTLYYRVTKLGQHVMSTALRLRNLDVALVGS